MRLSEMYFLVHNALDHWVDPKILEDKKDGRIDAYYIDEYESVIEPLRELDIIPSIHKGISELYAISKRGRIGGRVYLNAQNVARVRSVLAGIKSSLLAMREMCETLGLTGDSVGFDVKLPPDITLEELSECTHDLNNALSQCPIFSGEDGEIEFHGVDVGSAWLTFVIIGAGAASILKALVEIVDKVLFVRSHYLTCKQQELEAQKSAMAAEGLKAFTDAHKDFMKSLQEKALEELASTHDLSDRDAQARLRVTMKLMGKWMNKGMEIYAAIDAPKEIKAVFPSVEAQELPEAILKMLEAPKDEEA